jgi:hypothetical protein
MVQLASRVWSKNFDTSIGIQVSGRKSAPNGTPDILLLRAAAQDREVFVGLIEKSMNFRCRTIGVDGCRLDD